MKRFLSLLALMLPASFLIAQDYPNGLVMDSVDPKGDSLFFREVRLKMQNIRKTQRRPTVALVLCGGGAKGAAEVGVMKVIEELDIPIDMICGTSIGGLVGGLYALGYDSAFIDSLMCNQDWGKTLTDKIDPKYISLYNKKYKSKYLLSVPFHYSGGKTEGSDVTYETGGSGKLRVKNDNANLTTQAGLASAAASLPSGYVYGLNVNNLLASLSVGYQDDISFSTLPIPFCCVATEMVSCKEKNWGKGDLKTALRSTMSIPGLFSPVKTEGMVLVDGGMRNNFPNDLAKKMGADIIIGIDLTDPFATYDDVSKVGTFVGQFFTMMGRQSYETNKDAATVYIKPDLTGYSMMSFKKEAIDSMICRGYRAGCEKRRELMAVKKRVGSAGFKLCKAPAVNVNDRKVRIESVKFAGVSKSSAAILEKKTGLHSGYYVDAAELERAISIIQATGAVESVTWSLLGENEPYNLVFNCVAAPTHQFGIGLRLDSEIWAEVALNFGLNTRKLAGPKLDVNAKIGKSQSISAKFMLEYTGIPTLNVEASVGNQNFYDHFPIFNDMISKYTVSAWNHSEQIYISANKWTNLDGQLGVRNRYFKIRDNTVNNYVINDANTGGNYFGAFFKFNYSNFSDRYFPADGVDVAGGFDCDFLKADVKTFSPIYTFNIDVKGVIPFSRSGVVALIPDFHWRSVFDKHAYFGKDETCPEFSFYHRNFFGGTIAGKHFEQQIPFVGINNVCCAMATEPDGTVFSYDHIAVLNLDLRVRIIKNLYASALGGYVHMAPNMGDMFTFNRNKDFFGAGLQIAYNTIVGPIRANAHWCNRDSAFKNCIGFYISAGFDF